MKVLCGVIPTSKWCLSCQLYRWAFTSLTGTLNSWHKIKIHLQYTQRYGKMMIFEKSQKNQDVPIKLRIGRECSTLRSSYCFFALLAYLQPFWLLVFRRNSTCPTPARDGTWVMGWLCCTALDLIPCPLAFNHPWGKNRHQDPRCRRLQHNWNQVSWFMLFEFGPLSCLSRIY